MTKYRKIQRPQEAYMITCDNCGKEDGPWPSLGDGPHYCGHCGHICRQNDAFEKHKHLKGARVIGFRFDGARDARVMSLILKKGNRTYEIWARGHDYDGEDDRALIINDRLRRVASCYAFKREKPPQRKR